MRGNAWMALMVRPAPMNCWGGTQGYESRRVKVVSKRGDKVRIQWVERSRYTFKYLKHYWVSKNSVILDKDRRQSQ